MASKHAALYFEAYKPHHLVCSSLHTLSCEVSRVQGGGGGNGRVPASSSASSEFEAKACAMRPTSRNARRHLPQDGQRRRCVPFKQLLAVSQCLASTRFTTNDWYWASPMAVDCGPDLHFWMSTYTFWIFSHTSTHARTLMTDDGLFCYCVIPM